MNTEFQFSWDEMVLENPESYQKMVDKVAKAIRDADLHADYVRDYESPPWDNLAVAALKAIWEEDEE